MKKIFLISIIGLLLFSCNKNEAHVCGVEDPIAQLDWLSEIVTKAETDTTGNYKGSIYLGNYKDKTIIVCDMAMGSGAIMYHFFNCDGSNIIFVEPESPLAVKIYKNEILYTNLPNYK